MDGHTAVASKRFSWQDKSRAVGNWQSCKLFNFSAYIFLAVPSDGHMDCKLRAAKDAPLVRRTVEIEKCDT